MACDVCGGPVGDGRRVYRRESKRRRRLFGELVTWQVIAFCAECTTLIDLVSPPDKTAEVIAYLDAVLTTPEVRVHGNWHPYGAYGVPDRIDLVDEIGQCG